MRGERGSMLPMAAGLIFVAFSVAALVVEISLLGAAYRDVATVADLAAESAAAKLSNAGAYEAVISLDVEAAVAEAERVGGMWGSGDERVTVQADHARVCVTITDVYRPRTLAFIGVRTVVVKATGCAIPIAG
ncbi:MAG: hypothetical protein QGD89_01255 [Actinomycetota bacterium]|nr:hypothetical protein [Actinomycetota bacterium]